MGMCCAQHFLANSTSFHLTFLHLLHRRSTHPIPCHSLRTWWWRPSTARLCWCIQTHYSIVYLQLAHNIKALYLSHLRFLHIPPPLHPQTRNSHSPQHRAASFWVSSMPQRNYPDVAVQFLQWLQPYINCLHLFQPASNCQMWHVTCAFIPIPWFLQFHTCTLTLAPQYVVIDIAYLMGILHTITIRTALELKPQNYETLSNHLMWILVFPQWTRRVGICQNQTSLSTRPWRCCSWCAAGWMPLCLQLSPACPISRQANGIWQSCTNHWELKITCERIRQRIRMWTKRLSICKLGT